MGPWQIRDESQPYLPGCDFRTVRKLVRANRITRDTIIRGPTTGQFWVRARNVPALANLLGECHCCHEEVSPGAESCPICGADFTPAEDRQRLGLLPVHLLPGQADPERIAASAREPEPPSARSDSDAQDSIHARRVGRLERRLQAQQRTGRWLAGMLVLLGATLALGVILPIVGVDWTEALTGGREAQTPRMQPDADRDRESTPAPEAQGDSVPGESPARPIPDESQPTEDRAQPAPAQPAAEQKGTIQGRSDRADAGFPVAPPNPLVKTIALVRQGTPESLEGAIGWLEGLADGRVQSPASAWLAAARGRLEQIPLRTLP